MAEPLTFRISLAAPLDLPASLAPLGRFGDDHIDRWDGRRLLRVARLDGGPVAYRAVVAGGAARPRFDVSAQLSESARERLEHAIRASFVTDARALRQLAAGDPAVARLAATYPGLVPVLVPDPLSALIRSISAQQVNLGWAAEIRRRLARRFGLEHDAAGETVYSFQAERLARASEADLRELQLTWAKARAVRACARAAADGELERSELERLEDEQLVERLTRLPGIGRWSAEWFLARTLGRPRVVSGDLGVRKAIGRLYGTPALPSEADVRGLTAHWGAAASLAQVLALHDLAERPQPRRSVSPAVSSLRRAPATRPARSSRPARRAGRPGTLPPRTL